MAGYNKGFHCPRCDGPTYGPTTLCRKCKKETDEYDLREAEAANERYHQDDDDVAATVLAD